MVHPTRNFQLKDQNLQASLCFECMTVRKNRRRSSNAYKMALSQTSFCWQLTLTLDWVWELNKKLGLKSARCEVRQAPCWSNISLTQSPDDCHFFSDRNEQPRRIVHHPLFFFFRIVVRFSGRQIIRRVWGLIIAISDAPKYRFPNFGTWTGGGW